MQPLSDKPVLVCAASPTTPPTVPIPETVALGDEAALLATCLAAPDDLMPRLVYADWLEEHGHAVVAEFVRLDCAPGAIEKPSKKRRDECLPAAREYWRPRLGGFTDEPLRRSFDRRLPTRVVVNLQRVSDLLADEAWPGQLAFCTALSLRQFGRPATGLCQAMMLEAGRRRRDPLATAFVVKLADCPALSAVSDFYVSDAMIGSEGAAALADSPHLRGLRSLSLSRAMISSRGAAALAESPCLEGLERLALGLDQIGDEGIAALSASPHLKSLRQLDVRSNEIEGAGIAALARSRLLARLTRLDLSGNEFGDDGTATLAASPGLAGLANLNLASNWLTDAAVVTLAQSPHLSGLTRLGLEWNDLTDAAALALAASPHLASLEEVRFDGVRVSRAGAEALRRSPRLKRLRAVRRLRGGW